MIPSDRTSARACCERIDHVEIKGSIKVNRATHFLVQVFHKKLQSNSRMPGAQSPVAVANAVPDAVLHHSFSTFMNLRHECYFHASTNHTSSRSCSFCTSMVKLLDDGPTLPRLNLKLIHGNESICQALESFLNSVLLLVNTIPTTGPSQLCDGQDEITQLLHTFLSVPDEAPLQSTVHDVSNSTSPNWTF